MAVRAVIGHGHHVLRRRSAGIFVCPGVAMSIPDRPLIGHDPVIRSVIWSGAVRASTLLAGCSARSRGLVVRAPVQNWLSGGSTMTGEPGAKRASRPSTDERAEGQGVLDLDARERDYLLAWVGQNLTLVRRSASGERPQYWVLGTVLVVGLVAHVGGFLLKASTTTEPLSLVGDLIYTFGWALWTGAVVVVFVQIWPEAKRRQFKQALDAYEAAMGNQAPAGSGQVPDPAGATSQHAGPK